MTIQTNDRNERIDPNPGFILKPEAGIPTPCRSAAWPDRPERPDRRDRPN